MRNGASGRCSASCSARSVRARALWSEARRSLWRRNASSAFFVTVCSSSRLAPRRGTRRPTARSARRGEELLVERDVVGKLGHEHLARDVDGIGAAVELFEQAPDQLRLREVFDLVDHQRLAADDAALSHEEDLHRGLELVVDHPDGVVVLFLGVDHLLALDGLGDRDDLVAEARGALELQRVARLVHVLVEPVEDRRGVAVEELEQLVDETVVLLVGDRTDARRRALLDVRVEARATEPLVAVELALRARADRERPEEQVEGLPDRVGVGVRPEVADPLALRAPEHHRPGPFLVERDREVRVGLVVVVPDVEAGPVLLDEVELEEQGLDLVADPDPLDGVGRRHHLAGALHQAGAEVRHHPAPEALRLADVDHPPARVLELVRPRRIRNGRRFRLLHSPIVAAPRPRLAPLPASRVQAAPRPSLVRWQSRPGIPATYQLRGRQPRGGRPGCPRRPLPEPIPLGGITCCDCRLPCRTATPSRPRTSSTVGSPRRRPSSATGS